MENELPGITDEYGVEKDMADVAEFQECVENEKVDEVEEVLGDPELGMEFGTIDEYMEYFTRYGNQKGFPVKIRSTEKGQDGAVKFVILACARSGISKCKSRNPFKLHPVSKIGCKAKIRAAICSDGKLRVTTLTLDHNHELSPGKLRFYKRNRKMSNYVKRKLVYNDKASINTSKTFGSFLYEAGGNENLEFIKKDCYNYVNQYRCLTLGDGDAMALQHYFQKMQANNADFFYLIDMDDDGRLRNIFWADARSKAAYEEFGDAVTFDTTYLTNKYDMPFAPFVGVNHHGQSTLFGCGLISNENEKTFIWLFETWLACMNGHAPTAIITDQDKAMKKAIEIVFPNTRHRWCLWHIMKKLPVKLSGCTQYESIKYAMQKAVYDSLTCEEFDGRWNSFIKEFNLEENKWLSGLYSEKSRWVPVLLRNTFWAGMSSTQRSESMNAFFDGYVNSKTSLKKFVEQYENALRSKVQKENEEDFNSFDRWIPCITDYPFEKQVQDAYTTAKFKEFQDEVKGQLYCVISSVKEECGFQVYDVAQNMFVGTKTHRATFRVCFRENDSDIKCNCQLFEFRGILCKHALTVLVHKQIYTLPDKYIIRRWRKDVKRRHKKIKIIYSDWELNPENGRFDKMCNAFFEAADLAAENEGKTEMVFRWIKGLLNELKISDEIDEGSHASTPEIRTQVHSGGRNPLAVESNKILSPLVVRRKGRPRSKRFESTIEKVVRKEKEKQKKAEKRLEEKGTEKKELGMKRATGTNMDTINLEKASQSSYAIHGSKKYRTHDSFNLDMPVPNVLGSVSREPNVLGVPSGTNFMGLDASRSFPNGTNGMGFLNVPDTPGSSNSQRLDARLNFSNGTNGMGILNVPDTPSSSNYQGLDTRRSFSNGRNGMGFSNAVSFEWADYYPFLRGEGFNPKK